MGEEEAPHVKLEPVALTYDQVVEWELPRKPIKEADLRKTGWEERFGEGAVEVDALEARYHRRLGRLVRERVESLQDTTLRQRVEDAAELADQWVGGTVRQVVERHRATAQETVSECNEIAARYW